MKNSNILILICAVALWSCSDDEPASGWRVTEGDGDQSAYGSGSDVIITSTGDTYVVTPTGDDPSTDCVQLADTGECVDLSEAKGRYCDEDGAQADLILDENGDVIEVICYPPADDGTPIEELEPDEDGNISLPQNQNGVVITFPSDTDGSTLTGDLEVNGERATLYGNGVDETIIDGNLTVDSNNSRVRGLTIQGDVNYNGNNSKLVLCRITGDLNVKSNGFSVADCEVFGNVEVDGNDAILVNVGVQGEWTVNSKATCEGCYSFADENENGLIDEGEHGDSIECGADNN